jgi:hypothetical protein
MKDNRNLLLAILGGAVALAFTQRKTIMLYGAQALQAGKDLAFKAALSTQAKPYSNLILQVARETGMDPFLIYALGQRESRWGAALDKNMTGDGGHGRGIMQIDDRSFAAWLAANPWQDPLTNVRKGANVLAAKLAFFSKASPVPGLTDGKTVIVGSSSASTRGVKPGNYPDPRPLYGSRLVEAGIAAYNTGEGNVLRSLATGVDVDRTTAGGDYYADVWDKMMDAVARFTA